jgi:hypothetical protein
MLSTNVLWLNSFCLLNSPSHIWASRKELFSLRECAHYGDNHPNRTIGRWWDFNPKTAVPKRHSLANSAPFTLQTVGINIHGPRSASISCTRCFRMSVSR